MPRIRSKIPQRVQVGESYADVFTTARMNQVPDSIQEITRALQALSPEPGTNPSHFVLFNGEIVTAGPNKEADYTDSRYWVKVLSAKVLSGTDERAKLDFQDEDLPGMSGTFTVTNMPEVKAQSHTLSKGTRVTVYLPWNTKGTPYLFMKEYPGGFFPVLVKQNGGSDGSNTAYATWAYDLYALSDTSYATKLNTSGALQPKRSAARVMKCSVAQASNGSVGLAYFDASGVIQLWDCQELNPQTNCT